MSPPNQNSSKEILLFKKGEVLFALIETTKEIDPCLQQLVVHHRPTRYLTEAGWLDIRDDSHISKSTFFVPITLDEDLYLVIKTPNRIELKSCQCSVFFPAKKWTGISLNHAYTKISQEFKPHLHSHTGNAFTKIHYCTSWFDLIFDEPGTLTLLPLDEIRKQKVGAYESRQTFRRALLTALNFHGEQTRKGGSIPYISHLLAVAALVMEFGGNEDEIIAALLHDAVEDHGKSALSEIKNKFSMKIADIVSECTDTMKSPKPDWKPRKEKFLARLGEVSESARLVIAADKLHNARCILSDFRLVGDDVWERFSGKKDGTLWYYHSISEIFKKTGPRLLAAELGRVVGEIEKLAEIPRAGLGVQMDKIQAELNYKKLQEMIGLDELKQLIEKDIGVVLHNQQLREEGLENPPTVSLHLAFVGNPGTGKTKVARLLGTIYKNLGLLSKGHVYEVSRADLVGDVFGATEKRTRAAIERAKGGFLFIDEAYALNKPGNTDFGVEAIEVLLKAMSDITSDFGVIVAGYPEPMNEFLGSNPGLRSRFRGREISFADYTPEKMLKIAKSSVEKIQLQIADDALRYLEGQFRDAYRNRDGSFGNARYVNGIILDAKATLAERLRPLQQKPTYDELTTITLADVQRVFEKKEIKSVDLPVNEDALREALDQLQKLAGIPTVKQEVMELVDLVRYHRSIGKDPRKIISSHFVFTGNPGTGKTSVARILAQIFRALGLLEHGHLVECDRQALVAGYIGQTVLKTAAIIEKAHGGVLFIDEAYSLTPRSYKDFGAEAIEVLLKKMEDQRGKFVVIVAGYPREMEEFLKSNPGLKSRFDTLIHFEDYDSEELVSIAKCIFAEENLSPDQEAADFMQAYFDKYVRVRNQFSGNARDVRNLVKKSIKNQNLRLARLGKKNGGSEDEHQLIRTEDLSNWEYPNVPQKVPMGFFRT